jgi:hypothetical protein
MATTKPAPGDPFKFEGHGYVLTAFDDRGIFRFDRAEGVEAPKRFGFGNTADLRWAEDEKSWYLPWRVAPRLSGVLAGLEQSGASVDTCNVIRRAVHGHVAYLEHGRDDIALIAALDAHLGG